jgi:hypothetical protein
MGMVLLYPAHTLPIAILNAVPSGYSVAARGHLFRSRTPMFQATNAPIPLAQVTTASSSGRRVRFFLAYFECHRRASTYNLYGHFWLSQIPPATPTCGLSFLQARAPYNLVTGVREVYSG